MTPPVALTIAGSDSGGAAGIQADLKTFAAHGVFGCSAITALTAQNTVGVHDVHVPPPEFLQAQVTAVLDDLPVAAVKTGMLATAAIVTVVGTLAEGGRLKNLVVDPVMVASTGARLLALDATSAYLDRLLPHALVATPNLREAEVLLDVTIRTRRAQHDAGRALAEHGPPFVVVTGGHAVSDTTAVAVDMVVDRDRDQVVELEAPRIDTHNTHGSGCTFASAVAAGVALGQPPMEAIVRAHDWVRTAIAGGANWSLGAGHGPLDHFAPPPDQPAHTSRQETP